jgi:hypothetical protein
MKLITFFLHAPQSPKSKPVFVPISGDFDSVVEAKTIAIATALKNARFSDWCVAIEIEDQTGKIVASWSKDDAQRP